MKKNLKSISFALVAFLLLASCGSGKVVTDAQKTMRGNWILNNISYPGSTGTFNVTLFNDAKANCLENSQWYFVANNNTGTYTINGPGCTAGERNFNWAVQEVDQQTGNYDFMLKPTDERNRSVTNNAGFRIDLVLLNDTNMVWEQTVNFEGSAFTIRMEFSKL